MDDDLDLLHGSGGGGGSRRPPWTLLAGIAVVALLTLVGVAWLVSAVVGRDPTVAAAPGVSPSASPTSSPSPSVEPTTPAAATDTGFPTSLPTTTPPPAPTYSVPSIAVPSAVTVAPVPVTTRPPLPRPTPRVPPAGSVSVPSVVGMKVKAATASLRAAGFKVQVLGGVFAPDRDQRRVTAQRPGGGALARRGATVILVTDGL